MKENLSALYDGELSSEELEPLLERLCSDEEFQREWKMYCLLRSMTRGECTNSYFNSVLADATQTETDDLQAIENKPKRSERFFSNWNFGFTSLSFGQGGFRLAASVSVAVLVGFIFGFSFQYSPYDPNPPVPFIHEAATVGATPAEQFETDAIAAIDESAATRWKFKDVSATLDREMNLNKLLLEHSLFSRGPASSRHFGSRVMLINYDY